MFAFLSFVYFFLLPFVAYYLYLLLSLIFATHSHHSPFVQFLISSIFDSVVFFLNINHTAQSNDSAVFVIPNYINLTPHQHALLTEAGQQPGVPFRIMNDGAERPQGERRKISIAENFVNLRKSSVTLIEDSKRKYAISFSYDAKVKCRATIYLGAKDKTNGQTIRIGSALLLWGPFELQSGINCTWSSKYENCFAEESSLPGMYCKTAPDTFDIIIILDPSEAISNIRERRRKDVDRDREKRLSTGGGGVGLSTALFPIHLNNSIIPPSYNYNKDVLMQASYLKILGYGEANFDRNKLTFLYQKVMLASGVYLLQELYGIDQNNNHDKNNNISLKKSFSQRSSSSQRHSFVSSTSTVMVDINGSTSKQQQQQHHSSTTPMTPVNTLKNGKISLNINIFSKRPVVASTPASASASPSSQDNLTINPNPNKANDTNTSSSSLTSLQPLKAINNYMSSPTTATVTSPNPPPDHEAYDTDSNECVICLTDPKEVAVFPCRHMCLCETCAEALPSQGNKCPICRREACLLLRVHNLMARNGVENPP